MPEGTWCYDITLSKGGMSKGGTSQVIGQAFQSLERVSHGGKPELKVVVHQRMGAKFDMRDAFLLDAATLRRVLDPSDRPARSRRASASSTWKAFDAAK